MERDKECKRNPLPGKFRPARKVLRLEHSLNHGLGEIELPVKMPVTCCWTDRPRGALLYSDIGAYRKLCSVGGSVFQPNGLKMRQ